MALDAAHVVDLLGSHQVLQAVFRRFSVREAPAGERKQVYQLRLIMEIGQR
jgi:hypothetical protein